MESGRELDNSQHAVASMVGLVRGPDGKKVVGSCCPVSRTVLATCYHVLGDTDDLRRTRLIEWPGETLVRVATVAEVSEADDVAFLVLDEPLPDSMEILPLGIRHTSGGPFLSFGFRKPSHYKGLYSGGTIAGQVRATDGRTLLQLDTGDIEIGMSGAPVVDSSYRTVVGIVTEYWRGDERGADSVAFATPVACLIAVRPELASLVPDLTAAPKDMESGLAHGHVAQVHSSRSVTPESLVRASLQAALLVAADQYADGAWGRSLWRESSGALTSDVVDREQLFNTHQKKAISVTAWAAQALAKSAGDTQISAVQRAARFVADHQDEATGAFGNVYPSMSATPMVAQQTFVRNPRHTASGLKLTELSRGICREVIRAVEFILEHECPRGGWGEAIGDRPNTLTTAYVLDALIKASQAPGLSAHLSPVASARLRPAVNRSMSWLVEQRGGDGFWEYAGNGAMKPLYTAHVLAFVPQMSTLFPEEVRMSLDVLTTLDSDGAVPSALGGPPDIASTALTLYALLKTDPVGYESVVNRKLAWIVARLDSDEWQTSYSSMQGIFVLMALTQLPGGHRAALVPAINDMFRDASIAAMRQGEGLAPWLEISDRHGLAVGSALEAMYS